jgi:hypothetical protein
MISLTFVLEYDWGTTIEHDAVSFVPAPSYGFVSAIEAHDFVLGFAVTTAFFVVRDADGDEWPFHSETIRSFCARST